MGAATGTTSPRGWFRVLPSLLLVVAVIIAVASRRPRHARQRLLNDDFIIKDIHQQPIRKLDAALGEGSDAVLNVHVVPHTHDDVGWLKTVEEYYLGLNMTIKADCVRDILDTTVDALSEHPNRTFTYVEQKFFSMWWNEQTDDVKESVRHLVNNQQLGFVNGGWCMHDEAATHYMGMIDQTTTGHDFLKRELGVIPTVGWQLDPFGHSATQASLLTSSLGFNALYFGRMDYQDLRIRQDTQECEGLWSSSKSAGSNSTIFWGLTGSYSGNYGPPPGFCFDENRCGTGNFMTKMNRTQLVKKVEQFLQDMKVQSDRTKGNHIMLTMGGDFNYANASQIFDNIDLLLKSLELFQKSGMVDVAAVLGPRFEKINVFYSSPDYYTQMKYEQTKTSWGDKKISEENGPNQANPSSPSNGVSWSIKRDDFFPYGTTEHSFWTAYFTSRPALKRLERVGSSFLLAARQIQSFPLDLDSEQMKSHSNDGENPLFELEDAMGVVQHHDGVSGTSKQHVANDYSKRVQAGINKAAKFIAEKLKHMIGGNQTLENLDNLSFCQLVNETICDISQEASREQKTMHVVVYNPLGSSKASIVYLPVSVDSSFEVTRLGVQPATSNNIRSSPSPFGGIRPTSAKYVLAFDTGALLPLGASVFRVKKVGSHHSDDNQNFDIAGSRRLGMSDGSHFEEKRQTDEVVVSNGLLEVYFDKGSGAMTQVISQDEDKKTRLALSQVWGYYTSFDNTIDEAPDKTKRADQNSGAYIFRPHKPNEELKVIGYSPKGAKFIETSVGTEVHVEFQEPWIKQVTRVLKGVPYIEVEYTVGPIPIDDKRGKEIVTRFVTPIQSNGTFYTDSNGREFQKRQRNYRPSWPLELFEPVAGNFYPVNAAIYLEDEAASLSLLVDRSQGGSSLQDGDIEIMPHHRQLVDDGCGLLEPLNETDGGVTPYPPYGNAQRYGNGMIIGGKYRVMVGGGRMGASMARSEMDSAFASPLVFAAAAAASSSSSTETELAHLDSISLLRKDLPPNVMLVTFKKLDENESAYLIRLGHQYGLEDDSELSKPVTLDLSALFVGFKVVSVTEMTLSGNQKYDDWVDKRFDWVGSGAFTKSTLSGNSFVISLGPMDVRTFKMDMKPESK